MATKAVKDVCIHLEFDVYKSKVDALDFVIGRYLVAFSSRSDCRYAVYNKWKIASTSWLVSNKLTAEQQAEAVSTYVKYWQELSKEHPDKFFNGATNESAKSYKNFLRSIQALLDPVFNADVEEFKKKRAVREAEEKRAKAAHKKQTQAERKEYDLGLLNTLAEQYGFALEKKKPAQAPKKAGAKKPITKEEKK